MDYFVWDVSRVIFTIPLGAKALPIRWYSLMFMSAFVVGMILMKSMFRRENKSFEVYDFLLPYVFIATLVGARLGHILFYNPVVYLTDPVRVFKIWEGGLASHGGYLFVILSLILLARRYRHEVSFFWLADRCAIAGMFCAGFIRIGNFFNSEIIGLTTTVPWAVIFARVDNFPRHPTQLYESLGYFYIGLCFYLFYRIKQGKIGEGRLFGAVMVCGFLYRMFIERFKENHAAFEQDLLMNMGQMLSVPFILLGLYLLTGHQKRSSLWRWARLSDNIRSQQRETSSASS